MWYDAEYSTEPSTLDNTSSNSTIYVRKNIARTEKTDTEGKTEVVWTCKEQKIAKADWNLYERIINHDTELTEVQDALIELAEIIGG